MLSSRRAQSIPNDSDARLKEKDITNFKDEAFRTQLFT